MGFSYSCFISYCHGQRSLMNGFISEFKDNLESSLEPYFDEGVYIDEERLKPGFKYNIALSKAICKSLCMVVIYIPKYERHEYCRKEFAAMEYLEQERFKLIKDQRVDEFGMIIPVILRGDTGSLPIKIRKYIHYSDFSKYTTASDKLDKDKENVEKIESIARYINSLYRIVESCGIDIFNNCDAFKLPESVPPWNGSSANQTFPGHWEDTHGF